MKGRFIWGAIVMFTLSATATAKEIINKQVTVSQQTSIALNINEVSYIRGTISSDKPLSNISVQNSHQKIIKNLLVNGAKETEVFWLTNEIQPYKLIISPQEGTTANVKIELHTLPLKSDQFVSPEQPLLSPSLQTVNKQLQSGDQNAEQAFWALVEQQGTPLIEPGKDGYKLLTFLWNGKSNTNNVRVLGSPYEGHVHLSRLSNSSIWYKTYEIPDTSRFSYTIAPNVPQIAGDAKKNWREQRRAVLATAQADPLNHHPTFGEFDGLFPAASTVTLPGASSDRVTKPQGNPQGQLSRYQYHSQQLNNTRDISVYTPNKRYQLDETSPLLILFDGDAYTTKVPTPVILDNLIAENKIPPMSAVFINNPIPSLRAKELTPNDEFAHFMATEFKPWLCEHHNLCPDASNTVLSGSSFGGLASMYIAFSYPESFGKVLSQSGSFWWAPTPDSSEWLTQQMTQSVTKPIEIYMNAGTFETKPDFANILDKNKKLYQHLKNQGYKVTFTETAGGHDYYNWRVMLAEGLTDLFTNTRSNSGMR